MDDGGGVAAAERRRSMSCHRRECSADGVERGRAVVFFFSSSTPVGSQLVFNAAEAAQENLSQRKGNKGDGILNCSECVVTHSREGEIKASNVSSATSTSRVWSEASQTQNGTANEI